VRRELLAPFVGKKFVGGFEGLPPAPSIGRGSVRLTEKWLRRKQQEQREEGAESVHPGEIAFGCDAGWQTSGFFGKNGFCHHNRYNDANTSPAWLTKIMERAEYDIEFCVSFFNDFQ